MRRTKVLNYRITHMRGSFKLKIVSAFLTAAIFALSACDRTPEFNFAPAFSYELADENIVMFYNESEGEYIWMTWDFGNGETLTTLDKKQIIQTYYAQAGLYRISLKVSDANGNSDTTSTTIEIPEDDLQVSFSAEFDESDPYLLNLSNTTTGNYDLARWKYRNRELENVKDLAAYLPFAGRYEIELVIEKNGYQFSSSKSITISQDDPQYFNKLTLTWSDEFEGPDINSANWTFETGATGWGNNELQNYTNGANAIIQDGILVLTATKINENTQVGSYNSTRMITKNKEEFTYGRIEIRAKLPSGRGIWPAIWMLGSNISQVDWPACGEIDIMEYVGYEPDVIHSTVHTPSGYNADGSGSSKTLTTAEEEFHVYGMLWTERKIVFYTDSPSNVTHSYSPSVKTAENWPFNLPQFFILNIAVGGNWGGVQGIDNSIFPQSMEIDYLRVYQEPG